MSILIKNIKKLLQIRPVEIKVVSGKDMKELPSIDNAFLLVGDGRIEDFGKMEDCPNINVKDVYDAKGCMVLPSWCDSHTHIVYAGDRSSEYMDRIKGLTYEEIAEKGGGILNSVKLLERTSEEDLYNQSMERINNIIKLGTGSIEIKSGYGLSYDGELKMLEVIKRIKENTDLQVKSTFLGAHAYPKQYKEDKESYLDLIINKMIPDFSSKKLMDFIDVFCEKSYFSKEDTEKIINEGKKYNIPAKIHVNQFNSFGGVEIAVKNKALSVDHLEVLTNDDLKSLKNGNTIPVVLPVCSFFLGIDYAPARKIIDSGLPLAIASDYNPGSSPSGNMKITSEEAINAATINGAFAMNLSDKVGSIAKGKIANLIITNQIKSIDEIPYSLGNNSINKLILNGKFNNL